MRWWRRKATAPPPAQPGGWGPPAQAAAQAPAWAAAPARPSAQAPAPAWTASPAQAATPAQSQPHSQPQAGANAAVPAPAAAPASPAAHAASLQVPPVVPEQNAWPGVCEQFSQQLLLLTEHLRPAMDQLEGEEDDPDRLELLYQVDHAVTRMRRAAREMSVLAGSGAEEMGGHTTSLVDAVRLAESSIERYTQVVIGKVVQLAVVPYAADDVASLLVVLLDNATRYSPSKVTVSAHLLDNGAVMMRIEDSGIGIAPDRLQAVNAMLAGPVLPIGPDTARHTGFPVAHRLARKHGMGVRLACRPAASGSAQGTVAMVVIPPALLCELVDEPPVRPGPSPASGARPDGARDRSMAHLTIASRATPPPKPTDTAPAGPSFAPPSTASPSTAPSGAASSALPGSGAAGSAPTGFGPGGTASASAGPADSDPLPRRQSQSLRGSEKTSEMTPTLRSESAPNDRETAARSFAEDLEAFTMGGSDAGRPDAGDSPEGLTE